MKELSAVVAKELHWKSHSGPEPLITIKQKQTIQSASLLIYNDTKIKSDPSPYNILWVDLKQYFEPGDICHKSVWWYLIQDGESRCSVNGVYLERIYNSRLVRGRKVICDSVLLQDVGARDHRWPDFKDLGHTEALLCLLLYMPYTRASLSLHTLITLLISC